MAEYQQNEPIATTVNEAAEALPLTGDALRTNIITAVTQTNDEKLLRLVWSVLNDKRDEKKSLQLAQHIGTIFGAYPETLQKLAR